jgi:hypothetical protein
VLTGQAGASPGAAHWTPVIPTFRPACRPRSPSASPTSPRRRVAAANARSACGSRLISRA